MLLVAINTVISKILVILLFFVPYSYFKLEQVIIHILLLLE